MGVVLELSMAIAVTEVSERFHFLLSMLTRDTTDKERIVYMS